MSSSMADEHRARIEVFEYTAVEVIIHFYGVREAGEVFIYTVPESPASPAPEKYLYIDLHICNTFPGQKLAIYSSILIHFSSAGEVFIYAMPEKYLYTSPAPEKYLYTPEKYLYAPDRAGLMSF